jgi:hypothetical protein
MRRKRHFRADLELINPEIECIEQDNSAAVIGISLMGASNATLFMPAVLGTSNTCVRGYELVSLHSAKPGVSKAIADLRRGIRRDRLDGGGLSAAERHKIDRKQGRLGRQIYRQKHDNPTRQATESLQVVQKVQLQSDYTPPELGRQRGERIRGADARNRRAIKGFRSGRDGNHKFRNRTFLADCELNYNLSPPP